MARPRPLISKLTGFAQLNRRRRALLLESVVWLSVACLTLVLLPFRHVVTRLGTVVSPADDRIRLAREAVSTPERTHLAREVGWAVACAARWVPFRAACLPQAIAARTMLKRRGVASVMHLGAARGVCRRGLLEAHAWLEAAGVETTGYPVAYRFVAVASFV